MRNEYVFDGRFTAGTREDLVGPLKVILGECSLSIIGNQHLISRSMLSISPFHGSMFFGTITHSQREDVLNQGYELMLTGTTLGVYDSGGGKDGEFDVFKIKDARVKGTFGSSGLTVSVYARTLPGSEVCYSAQEERLNAYEAMDVTAKFVVPPKELQEFMMLGFSIDHEMFSKFSWS
jgi:hypothetical protein